jgi:hypothetical protein
MTDDRLDRRALNRATLQRQLLLRRSNRGVLDAVEHLVGLQAQVPLDPYVALWSRLSPFRAQDLSEALLDRRAVRAVLLRGTIHLTTARDCLRIRPLEQPVLDAELHRHQDYGPVLRDVDLAPVADYGRTVLAEPRTNAQLRAAMAERFPGVDAGALAYACRNRLCLIQVPPRGVWGRGGQVTTTTAEAWLGRPLEPKPSIDDLILRYLAAYGPATVADAATWTRLTGLREVFDRLRPRLQTFADERGRELFDVADGPRPDPDTPAPPRFLPEYDNVLLSHADRSRFVADPQPPGRGSLLIDGFLSGTWVTEMDAVTGAARLVVSVANAVPRKHAGAVDREGVELMRFLQPEAAAHDIRIVAVS